ncbi:hypothetical protein GGD56_005981 [Rhizobium mongolense]|uniref:Uncharacterized protein n=1 Tax=Rhizobium mongolense TaxID=57676 RepID=A0ABR6IVY8_9HYPH|nr:hypothetical protein [Rhizobium mongolense]
MKTSRSDRCRASHPTRTIQRQPPESPR